MSDRLVQEQLDRAAGFGRRSKSNALSSFSQCRRRRDAGAEWPTPGRVPHFCLQTHFTFPLCETALKAAVSRESVIFFWPFCVGLIMAATSKQSCRKRHLLHSAWAVKLFDRLTKLSWSDVHDTCANPIQGRLFWSSGGQGGGGGTKCPPLVKTLFPFSESTQVIFFWKLVQNWVLWSKSGFHGNHGYGFKVVHIFQFLTRNDDDDDDIYLKDSPTGTKPWSRGSP